MRNDKEKKSIVKTIKISPLQEQDIMERAKEKGMNFSEYMIDCAVHGNNGLTPQVTVKLQEMVNIVKDIADNLDTKEYVRCEELRQKTTELEGLFIPEPPQDKLDKLENNMGLFIEGGNNIWEFLK